MAAVVEILPINEDNDEGVKNVVFKKELLSFAKPFDLIQALYVLSMYRVRDGFITPNSVFYNVVSGIWWLLLWISYFFSVFKNIFIEELEGFKFIKFSSNIYIFVVYSFGNVTSYWSNIIQRHNNVRLAISIQKICEILKVNEKSLKNFTIFNWVYVITMNCFQVFWIVDFNFTFSLMFQLDEILVNWYYIIFDVNMLYCVRLIRLLSEPLKIWVDDARKSKYDAEADDELYWNRKFSVYMEIVETYEIIGKYFKTLILYFGIDTFTNGVISIWIRIELAKVVDASMITVLLSFISVSWMVKNILLISALCLECEKFYSVMTEVRSTCIQLAASDTCPEAQKRVCKNVQRVQTASFKKMSACGLYVIDGTLPLLLFGLLTTYVVVVLQFEFL